MHIRTAHYLLMNSSSVYSTAIQPVLWTGRYVSNILPKNLITLIDRIVFAFELLIPKIAFVAGATTLAQTISATVPAMGLLGILVWFTYDMANCFQFYPYDYLEDLWEESFQKEKESIVLRADLINRIVFYLTKPPMNNNNVMVVGPAGSGKTASALSLARFFQSEQCPPELKELKIYRLRLDKLMAGASSPGDFEMRFITLLNAMNCDKKSILFIDEAHQLVDRRGNGNTSLANLLKPFLTHGMRCLTATTIKEYQKHIADDEGFEQRFNLIEISALSRSACIQILQQKFPGLTSDAAQTAIEQAQALYPHKALPRSAIILLENTQHTTKSIPTKSAILDQIEFERKSLGSLGRHPLHSVS